MIPIAMPVLEKAEAEAAHEAVLSGWVSQGPQVAAFELEFAALHGRSPRLCGLELHDRASSGVTCRGCRTRR